MHRSKMTLRGKHFRTVDIWCIFVFQERVVKPVREVKTCKLEKKESFKLRKMDKIMLKFSDFSVMVVLKLIVLKDHKKELAQSEVN